MYRLLVLYLGYFNAFLTILPYSNCNLCLNKLITNSVFIANDKLINKLFFFLGHNPKWSSITSNSSICWNAICHLSVLTAFRYDHNDDGDDGVCH